MKLYLKLLGLEKTVFTIEDVKKIEKNQQCAKNHMVKLVDMGLVMRIKKNLYTCISPETRSPVANKYQIASAINESSFVSHHTALEYYGCFDQVFYDVYVSSSSKFNDFEFDGYRYRCVITKNNSQIVKPKFSNGIKLSSIERAIVESVKDMDKIAGIEEVISDIECLPSLDEKKLLDCLKIYDNQFLYQKIGFLFTPYKEQLHLSSTFFDECHQKIGKSRRYLTTQVPCHSLNHQWSLIVPAHLFEMKNGEDFYEI